MIISTFSKSLNHSLLSKMYTAKQISFLTENKIYFNPQWPIMWTFLPARKNIT